MMRPQFDIAPTEINRGLRYLISDGISSEIVTTLTNGTILSAVAILLGASNFEIGLLAAFPFLANLAQIFSIYLIRKYQNRRVLTVCAVFFARLPLLIIGMIMLNTENFSIIILLFGMAIHFFMSAIGGAGWNSWVRDLVPEDRFGSYFSRRNKFMQTTNILLSIAVALIIDTVEMNPECSLIHVYGAYFIIAAACGFIGTAFLAHVPEPVTKFNQGKLKNLLFIPFKNKNFLNMMVFNGLWVFSTNLAIPFFTVFMLKSLKLSLIFVIGLSIISQLFSVLTIQGWGNLSDRYSNKSLIYLTAPIYLFSLFLWMYVGIYSLAAVNLILLVIIHAFMGISGAGINLALTNIGLKLAPKEDAVIYLSIKNILTSIFSSVGPIVGGFLADFFMDKKLVLSLSWGSENNLQVLKLVDLYEWTFLFLLAAVMGILSLRFLAPIVEKGEVAHGTVRKIIRSRFRRNMKDAFIIGNLIAMHNNVKAVLQRGAKIKNSMHEK